MRISDRLRRLEILRNSQSEKPARKERKPQTPEETALIFEILQESGALPEWGKSQEFLDRHIKNNQIDLSNISESDKTTPVLLLMIEYEKEHPEIINSNVINLHPANDS